MLNGFAVKKAGKYFSKCQTGTEGKDLDGYRWTDDVQMALRFRSLSEARKAACQTDGDAVLVRKGKVEKEG